MEGRECGGGADGRSGGWAGDRGVAGNNGVAGDRDGGGAGDEFN